MQGREARGSEIVMVLGVGGEYVQMSVVPLALPLAGAMTYLFYLFSNEPPE